MKPSQKSVRDISLEWRSDLQAGREPVYAEIGNLLDDFRAHCRTPQERMALVSEPPVSTGQAETGPYLAALAESLCREFDMRPPAWTEQPDYYLKRPWFAGGLESLKAILLAESPTAFRRRNLFVSANALSRA
ncbi:MAG: hypothetical protein ACKOJB_16220 [Chthoniobacterales bacterium]